MANLREQIGKRVLKNRMKGHKRETRVYNFETASSAVILFDAQIKNGFHIVKEFRAFLKEKGINCSVYAFMNQKEIPKDMVFWKGYYIITRRNLNWYMKPVGDDMEQFKREDPDILVDFSLEPIIALQFLVQLSSARFKIGSFTEEKNDYDLMINLAEKNDMAFLSDQIVHYVSMLNPSN